VRTMIQEVGCDVGLKRIILVKVKSDFEILFRLMDGLCAGDERRDWISEHSIEVNSCDRGEDMRHKGIEVKITLSMSHNTLTRGEEHVK
jgi:hypothetical protein